jgi:two-component system sensor histidine kinase/response regulator
VWILISIYVKIIAMTANAMSSSIDACLVSGMSDYITKPVKIELLQQMLNKWLTT